MLQTILLVSLLAAATACAPRPKAQPTTTLDEARLASLNLTEQQRERLRAYMRGVEQRARRRHIQVIWVNPPPQALLVDAARLEQMLRDTHPAQR